MVVAKLRAVGVDERADPKSITEAADHGTRRELLVATRARVAAAVEDKNTPARDLASLTIRLMAIANEIEAIDAKEAGDSRAEVTDQPFNAEAI